MEVKVPETHQKAFSRIAQIEDTTFQSITSALGNEAPCLRLAELRKRLEKAISPVLPDETHLAEAVVALAATSSRQDSAAELLQAVVDSVGTSEGLDEPGKISLLDRLQTILKLPFIHVSARSSSLQVSYDRVFNSARVITDIRPVFQETLVNGWSYMVIHQLQVTCVRNDGTQPELLYVSLDDKDLDALQDTIVRAREKARVLSIYPIRF